MQKLYKELPSLLIQDGIVCRAGIRLQMQRLIKGKGGS